MDIASSIKKYKNSVTRKYISLSNDEIDVITKGDYWFSRKYDGQLWFYCKSNKNSIPDTIPLSPNKVYKKDGWKDWDDFLGRKNKKT